MAKRTRQPKQVAVTYKQPKVPRETLSLNKSKTIEKVASIDVPVSRMQLGAQGYDGLKTNNGAITEQANTELKWPRSLCTYKSMSLDPTIAAVNNFYNMMVSRADFKFEAPKYTEEKPFNPEGKSYTQDDVEKSVEFLNYCMKNMEGQTWREFISGIGTYRIYGFSIAEKLWTTVPTGKYRGRKKWKTLAQRSQETVEAWKWDANDPDKLSGVVQRPEALDTERYGTKKTTNRATKEQRTIDRNKFILFRFDPQKNNPQGTSPLNGCWEAWKYLQVVREYQAVGVAKDLGGVPVIGYPVEKLIEAAADPSGAAATTLNALKENAAKLHAGDEAFVIKPIDYTDTGKELYSFDLEGIKGGGKQYDTSEIIRDKKNEILTCFVASMLTMGQDATGSFALSDNMNNLLAFGIEHNLQIICDQVGYDLIPQTLALNGWKFEQEDMPTLAYGDIAPRDLDELGKFIQRTVTAGAMSTGKQLDNTLKSIADLPESTYDDEDVIPDDFKTSKESGAGKGDGTSGTGDSQNATGGDDNQENT